MRPKSHTLFHFTSQLAVLKSILKEGFWPKYCLEDVTWVAQEQLDYVAFPMVCFCDIPLARIDEHVEFYGGFGVGLTKDWALRNGMNPVLYIAGENELSRQICALNKYANALQDPDLLRDAKATMRFIIAHTKPSEGNVIVHGMPVRKEFYQESEWRYVPHGEGIKAYLKRETFESEDDLKCANTKVKEKFILKMSPGDIKYIFVKSDSDIPEIVKFIQNELDYFPAADVKLLTSRVTSLESITQDL